MGATMTSAALAGQGGRALRAQHTEVFKHFFGHTEFSDFQYHAVLRVLRGADTLAVAGTGSGKSAIAQYAAVVTCGIAVVVTPYCAIARDQVAQLRSARLPAVVIGAGGTLDNFGIAYTTPEAIDSGHALAYRAGT